MDVSARLQTESLKLDFFSPMESTSFVMPTCVFSGLVNWKAAEAAEKSSLLAIGSRWLCGA